MRTIYKLISSDTLTVIPCKTTEKQISKTQCLLTRVKSPRLSVTILSLQWPTTVTAKELTSRQKEKPHGKKNNLAAKRKTSRQKEKDQRQKENLTAKRISSRQKKKTHGFNSYFFCREVEVILFAVSTFLLP